MTQFLFTHSIRGDRALKLFGSSAAFLMNNVVYVTFYFVKRDGGHHMIYVRFHTFPHEVLEYRKGSGVACTIDVQELFKNPDKFRERLDYRRFEELVRACVHFLLGVSEKNLFRTRKLRVISNVRILSFTVLVANCIIAFFAKKYSCTNLVCFSLVGLQLKEFFRGIFSCTRSMSPEQGLALLLATAFVTSIRCGGFLIGLSCGNKLSPFSTLPSKPSGVAGLYFPLGALAFPEEVSSNKFQSQESQVLEASEFQSQESQVVEASEFQSQESQVVGGNECKVQRFYRERSDSLSLEISRDLMLESFLSGIKTYDFIALRKIGGSSQKFLMCFFRKERKDSWLNSKKDLWVTFGTRAFLLSTIHNDVRLALREYLAYSLCDLNAWKREKKTLLFYKSSQPEDVFLIFCELASFFLTVHGLHRQAKIDAVFSRLPNSLLSYEDFLDFTKVEANFFSDLEVLAIIVAHCFLTNLMRQGSLTFMYDDSVEAL